MWPCRASSGGVAGSMRPRGDQPRDVPDRQRLPGANIAYFARQRGARLLVDGAHSLALLPFTRDDIRCDMFTTCLHKWVNGPLGTGFFYVRRDRIGDTWPLHPADESLDDDISAVRTGGHAVGGAVLRHHGGARSARGDRRGAEAGAHQLAAQPARSRGSRGGRAFTIHASAADGLQTALLAVEIGEAAGAARHLVAVREARPLHDHRDARRAERGPHLAERLHDRRRESIAWPTPSSWRPPRGSNRRLAPPHRLCDRGCRCRVSCHLRSTFAPLSLIHRSTFAETSSAATLHAPANAPPRPMIFVE